MLVLIILGETTPAFLSVKIDCLYKTVWAVRGERWQSYACYNLLWSITQLALRIPCEMTVWFRCCSNILIRRELFIYFICTLGCTRHHLVPAAPPHGDVLLSRQRVTLQALREPSHPGALRLGCAGHLFYLFKLVVFTGVSTVLPTFFQGSVKYTLYISQQIVKGSVLYKSKSSQCLHILIPYFLLWRS